MIVLLRVTRSGRILDGSESDVKGAPRAAPSGPVALRSTIQRRGRWASASLWLSSARRLKERARPASHVDGV